MVVTYLVPTLNQRLLTGLLATLLPAALVSAGEGGVSVYQPGYFDSMAGYMPPPGQYGELKFFNYRDSTVDETVLEGAIVLDVETSINLGMFTYMVVPDLQLLGGQYGFSVTLPYGKVDVEGTLSLSGNELLRESDSATGNGDLAISPMILGWHSGKWHTMALLNVYLPVGKYDENDLANIGMNHYAVEPMYNITWFDEATGWEYSAALGYIYNFENDDTNYKNGQEFHAEGTVAKWGTNGWMFGVTAYWFRQLTGDSGAGAELGSYRGEVFGLGPLVSYTLPLANESELQFKLKYVNEISASNRLEGDAIWLNFAWAF